MSENTMSEKTVPVKKTKKKHSVERLMILFTTFFILGVVILLVVPEGSDAHPNPYFGVAMGVYSLLVFWSVFRFGM